MIELASSRRLFGSSSASMPASENGWTGSRRWPMTSVVVWIRRRSERCGAMRPKNRPWSTAAPGAGSWRTVSTRMSAAHGSRGTRRAPACTARISGSPKLSAIISGVKASAQASSAPSSTGISITMPRSRSGASAAASSAVLAPSDVPSTTASSIPRWSSSAITCSPNRLIE